ncbi:MAG: single-stranded DNA-binding protein [Streptosporangiaceae bacterium]
MFNDAHISLNGYVATQPQIGETRTGIPSLTMRVAWTPRLIDRVTGEWKDAGTSFLSVRLYRKLAENAATCLRKGDPVIVRGRFIVRDYEDKSGAKRTAVEVDAISVGHDLNRGVAQFSRVRPQIGLTAVQFQESESGPGGIDTDAFARITGLSERGALAAGDEDETSDRDDADGADHADGGDGAGSGDGGAFDEAAVDALTQEAASAAVPF